MKSYQDNGLRQQKTANQVEQFKPFPVEILGGAIHQFVDLASTSIGCDPSYVVLPLLATLAACIGNSRSLVIKRGWTAPAILWTVCIGESGSQKTPPFRLVLKALRDLQRKAMKDHDQTAREYENRKAAYESAMAQWRRKPEGDPPRKPDEPPTPRMIVSDTTVEALASVLADNPRGVLLARDELNGWIGSFDKYAKGKGGGDASHFLSMYQGETMTIDRKTGQRLTVVPNASVSITGGIQPAVFARAIHGEMRENGMAARLLTAYPPARPKRWVDADFPTEHLAQLGQIYGKLRGLSPGEDRNGDPFPVSVIMSASAKSRFVDFYNQHAAEQAELSGDLASVWSKLEEVSARLALVQHLTRWAAGENVDPWTLDDVSMSAGIDMVRWFGNESKRVYAMLDETEEESENRRLADWINRKGEPVTVRDVLTGNRRFKTSKDAEKAINQLSEAGYGTWDTLLQRGKGGQPTRIFRLASAQPHKTRVLASCAEADTADTSSPTSKQNGQCSHDKLRDEPCGDSIRTSCEQCGKFMGYRPAQKSR